MGYDGAHDDIRWCSYVRNAICRQNRRQAATAIFYRSRVKNCCRSQPCCAYIKKTLSFFEFWLSQPGKYLITDDYGNQLTYHQYRTRFDAVMTASRCKHTPHECRHTCATMLDNAGANDTAIKRILGHASQGVTKRVYTHKSLHELKKAIDLI